MQASEVANKRFVFFVAMWITYVTIVLTSTAVATIRFLMHEDGSLHVFITTTSNHLESLGADACHGMLLLHWPRFWLLCCISSSQSPATTWSGP